LRDLIVITFFYIFYFINISTSINHDYLIEEFAYIVPNCLLLGSIKIAIGSKIFKNILDNIVYNIKIIAFIYLL